MNKRLQISIPSPCNEKWQDMTGAEKGRFCASCQKVVHDFTRSSDREIASVFAKDKNACGRFINKQLDRDLVVPKEKSTIWTAASAAVVSLLALGINDAIAQTPIQTEQLPAHNEDIVGEAAITKPFKVISGTVTDSIDSMKTGIPGAIVIVKGTHRNVQTDFDGKYSIEAQEGEILEFYFVGYRTETITVEASNIINVELMAIEQIEVTMGIIITREKTTFFGRVFRTIGNWFRKEDVDVWYK